MHRNLQACGLHTSPQSLAKKAGKMSEGPKNWPKYNEVVWKPQKEDEPRRPAVRFLYIRSQLNKN